jgi:hypothetical protein
MAESMGGSARASRLRAALIVGGILAAMVVVAVVVLLVVVPGLRSPLARVAVTPTTGIDLDTLVAFDGTASKPRVAEALMRRERFSWDFGDGQTAEGATVTHRFSKSGDYDVELRYEVADSRNRIRQAVTYSRVSVQLPQLPPIVAVVRGAELPLWEGETARFDASASYLSPAASPSLKLTWDYAWDFGDGAFPARGSSVAHTFAGKGRYDAIVKLSVSDQFGRQQTAEIRPRVVVDARPLYVDSMGVGVTRTGKSVSVSLGGLPTGLGVGAYGWDALSDGVVDATTSAPAATIPFSVFGKPGKYPMTITMMDPEHGGPVTVNAVVTIPGGPSPEGGLAASGGLLSAGSMRLWNAGLGWSFESLGLTVLAQYGALTGQPPDVDRTGDFPEVDQAGYTIVAHIESASFFGVTAHYPPLELAGLGLVGTLGLLTVSGQYETSCRVTIDGQAPPILFSKDTIMVGVGIGFRLSYGLISLQVLFGL